MKEVRPFILFAMLLGLAPFGNLIPEQPEAAPGAKLRTRILQQAESHIGAPYLYGGTSAKGFDCSGFVWKVMKSVGVKMHRSSRDQIRNGDGKKLKLASPGDVLVFTGTNKSKRSPGHTGIVHHLAGDTIYFIHSSSKAGVNISPMYKGSYYHQRFLQLRDVATTALD